MQSLKESSWRMNASLSPSTQPCPSGSPAGTFTHLLPLFCQKGVSGQKVISPAVQLPRAPQTPFPLLV